MYRETNYSKVLGVLAIVLVATLAMSTGVSTLNGALAAETVKQIQMELPPPDIPQPQFFCGYCHVLTYPKVIKKGYELWKKDKHNKFGCVECHYPPQKESIPNHTSLPRNTQAVHIPKTPPERFSYVKLGGEVIGTRPRVIDASCMTANCHGNPKDTFKTKKIAFTEKVTFVHKPHFEKKNQIEGQKINCTSCHQHETDQRKFEVSKASCHLCHFTNVKFNEERGRCELCHTLPEKPIQTSGEQPITHKMLKESGVSCGSCHYDLIQASGRAAYEAYFENGVLKTAVVLGAGSIKKQNCRGCHDQTKALKEAGNKKLMHEKHVTVKTARCFDCHQLIRHKKADWIQPVVVKAESAQSAEEKIFHDQFIRDSCTACHPEPHRLQRLLAAGLKRKDVPQTPGFHLKARANCMACHQEMKITESGEKVLRASARACVKCHKGRENLLSDWKADLADVIREVKEVEQEALQALKEASATLPEPKVKEATRMLKEGRENFNMVRFGNGVHNKKYAMYVLDASISRYEDVLDYLEENQ